MRTKQMKIGGEEITAILMCGGKGFKIYSYDDKLLISKNRKLLQLENTESFYKIVINYVNLKYYNSNEQEDIKKEFMNFINKLRL